MTSASRRHVPRLSLAPRLPLAVALALSLAAGCDKGDEAPAAGRGAPKPGAGQAPAGDAKAAAPGGGGGEAAKGPFKRGPIAPTEPHAFSILDMLEMERLSDPQPSPDGNWVAFTRRTTDMEENRGRTDVWVVGIDGKGLRQITTDPGGDSNPRWSADGKHLYFASSRSGSRQVWKVAAEGGEPSQVTKLPLSVGALELTPDGRTLLLSMEVYVDCADLACTEKRLAERKEAKSSGQVYDRMFVRHWDTWKDGRRSHLFAMSAEGAGAPIDLTAGLDADVPSKPFGGSGDFTVSPDSKQVVFSARVQPKGEPWSTNFDLYAVPMNGSAKPRNLTEANPAWDASPAFSPDGKQLAYLAMSRPGFEADRYRIMLMDWASGESKEVAPEWDRSPGDLQFTPDGEALLAGANDLGEHPIFTINVATGEAKRLVEGGTASSVSVAGSRLVYARNDFTQPTELYASALDGSGPVALTHINDEALGRAKRGEPEAFSFKGAGGDTVHAWIVKPVDFDENKKYPLAFLIHGGPQGSFRSGFSYRWNPQAYAGAGYAAVMIDFHGSTGYGQKFTDSITGDWGGKPFKDLKKGLTETLKKYPWIDGERACALGASYGGYMINWISSQAPTTFKCLVNHDGVFDHRSMYFATEELWFPEWEHGGPYWASKGHEKHNPATQVAKWKTPTLVIHGELDYRVPVTQGLGAFTALQRQGIESKLLYFPDENHWVLKPQNSKLWHETVVGWLDRFTGKAGGEVAAK